MLTAFKKKEVLSRLAKLVSPASDDIDSLVLAYLYSKQAYRIDPNDPVTLEKFTTNLYNLKDFSNALECAEKWSDIVSSESDQRKKPNMLFMKGMSLFYLGKYDLAGEHLRTAIDSFTQPEDNEKILQARAALEDIQTKPSQEEKPVSEKREECAKVKKFIELNEIPDVPGKMVYIIPGDWLEKWKNFNNYYELSGDAEPKNFMEEEREKLHRVGPIDCTNILEDESNLIDSNPDELYTNFQLKLGLEENKDFYFASEEFWNYLHSKYGGVPIQRPTYRKSETNMTISVEAWLQKINAVLLPLPREVQPVDLKDKDVLYISKRKTIKDLVDKLIDVYSTFFPAESFKGKRRLWKVDPRFDLNDAWTKWNGGNHFEIHGTLLKEELSIEDAEISDEDTIIFETHYLNKGWFLEDSSIIKEKVKPKDDSVGAKFTNTKSFPSNAKKGLTGLQNLGNTCFMNSAIQCLSNTFDLTTFFLTNEYKRDVNTSNPLGSGGRLALNYSELMKEVWLGSSSYVSPWELKKTIGKLASQFVGYGQQDSQELLSYLLDGLHEDLNRVLKKPFVETKDDDNRPDHIVAQETWNNHLKRNQSRIQELMHGQFKSRLDCPDCKKVSITFDPYMMISLPIPTVEYTKFFLYFVFDNYQKIPLKISLNMPTNTPYPEILNKLVKIINVPKKNIVMGLLKEHKLIEFVDSSADALYLKDHPGILFGYELPSVDFTYNHKTGKKDDQAEASNEHSTDDVSQKTSTGDVEKMEAENENSPTGLPDLARIFIQAEPKAFYESEKTISYTRLIKLNPSDTYKDMHLKVYDRMRPYLYKYFEKEKMKNPIVIEEKSKEIILQEYKELFPEDNEVQWIYKLFMVNNSKEDPKTGKKSPCELCQKAKCARCVLPYEDEKVSKYINKMGVQSKELILELKIASKTVKLESLPLNQCTEYRNDDNDDANPNRNYNIYDCLNLFTRKEKLEKDNAWFCSKCKGHKQALKKMEIYKVPPVLILHLKRFKVSKTSSYYWSSGKKINVNIDFPIEGLDLSNYVLGEDRVHAIYDLYAVSNHYGSLSGGHYTAYAKNNVTGNWYDFNDSRVSQVNQKEVNSAAAYVLFYKKRNTE